MKKTVFVLVVLALGIGLWFYLLLGRNARMEDNASDRINQLSVDSVVEDKRVETQNAQVIATTSQDAPPQTDVGMEFPVLEE